MRFTWSSLFLAVTASAIILPSIDAQTQNCTDFNPFNGPLITPCKKEIILQKGENYTFTCKGKNPISFKQQDASEDNIGKFNSTNETKILSEEKFKYEVDLNLYNVDQFAIGYYACYENSIGYDALNNLVEEPENTELVSYIYIYVNGTDMLFAPMREFVVSKLDKVVIECRPTTPDVEVILRGSQSSNAPRIPKIINYKYSSKIGFVMEKCSLGIVCYGEKGSQNDTKKIRITSKPPVPKISGEFIRFLEGETFTLVCAVSYQMNNIVNMTWILPEGVDPASIIETTNAYDKLVPYGDTLYRNITIQNATRRHEGTYTCVSANHCGQERQSMPKKYLDKPILNFIRTKKDPIESKQKVLKVSVRIDSYPRARYYYLKNNERITTDNSDKYKEKFISFSNETELTILNTDVTDTGIYTLVAENGYLMKNITLDVRIRSNAEILQFEDKKCVLGTQTTIACKVAGYNLPRVTWILSYNGTETSVPSTYVDEESLYLLTAYLKIQRCDNSGSITCYAENDIDKKFKSNTSQTRQLMVYEMLNGFGIKSNNKSVWYNEGDDVSVQCLASKYDFDNVTWDIKNDDFNYKVEHSMNEFSLISTLKIYDISLNNSGIYECRAYPINEAQSSVSDGIEINVAALMLPSIIQPVANTEEYAFPGQSVQLSCQAVGVPLPKIQWFKDGELIINGTVDEIINANVNRTTTNSTIIIKEIKQENEGTYECVAVNDLDEQRKSYSLRTKGDIAITKYLIGIAVIIIALIILVGYLVWKVKKEKRFRKELAAAGLLYFKEGVPKSLNPELGIDEQAELLPYDDKFEFPAEKLRLGHQLGAGAFGVVYKAEARGIINAEEWTLVAVKMVKKTADNMYIKALASELKIMVHLGKHVNIVNLLGACTKNVGKRELAVIVEYCKFGNIHNYIFRHREVFIDQLTDNNKEKNLGKINPGFSYTGSTGVQSDYFGANTQETDHTFVNSANTNRSGRKISENYVQPEWRSNYESDYSYDGRAPRPLTSRDLLAWSFQIARGMEYLASRKVLHGDLAARNVLLADNNIVKICDFGLAKSIYKNDEYQKKENSPLPVKWLAIECMTDRIFSTQSDVWSFGIVLWELFSLAKTPYPNIRPTDLLQFLSEGNRLNKPEYADDRLYEVMKRCWEQKPTARPSFTELQETLGTFLEDNVRNQYVDLNNAYMDKNALTADHEDYLAMVSAPDYNNMVTPSPHYANVAKTFFPPSPNDVDEHGYLQVSPASYRNEMDLRSAPTKFDFSTRKFNSRLSDASNGGSELTPMLRLSNLSTRSGSESDHEGNNSQYLNMCPKIEEEKDEVFDNTKHNNVTNHMYIAFDKDMEKQPNNNYVNINRGLVK